MTEKIFETNSPEETEELAASFSRDSKEGDIFALTGDLGVGKSVFARGFARGLEIKSPVTSPTFTIVNEYNEGRLPLFHFDVYRIEDEEEMFDIGFDEYLTRGGVCLIEWAENIEGLLPRPYKKMIINKDLSRGVDFREIRILEII